MMQNLVAQMITYQFLLEKLNIDENVQEPRDSFEVAVQITSERAHNDEEFERNRVAL